MTIHVICPKYLTEMTAKAATALLLAVLPISSLAQVGDRRSDFSVGFNGGVTMNTMNFSPNIKQNKKNSPTFGINCRYVSEKYFSTICGLQLELNYANLGWDEKIEDGSEHTYTHSIHYAQLPMLMQMGWGKERKGLKFILEAGPQIGYAFSTGEKFGGGNWDTSKRPNNVVYQYDHDIDNHFDYGIVAGLGVEWTIGKSHLITHARYYYGLGDTYDNSKQGYFSRSANQTIEIKLTYLHDIKFPKIFKRKKKAANSKSSEANL